MRLDDLPTPALILDRGVFARNAAAMTARIARHGVRLRPHLKTAKCIEAAREMTAGNFGGITVSTLAEAAYFLDHGIRDITYAVGLVPSKFPAVARLLAGGARLSVVTDSPEVARALGKYDGFPAPLPVLIEIDSGHHRAGIAPESSALLEIGRILEEAPGLELEGVLTHAGHAYHARGAAAIAEVGEAERAAVVAAAERLRRSGLPCPVVSAGSTPTAVHVRALDGVTEMRPGVYGFFDLDQMALGCCRREDIALTVLASVIGCYPEQNRVLIDAGSLALSADTSAGELLDDAGYGWVLDVDGGTRLAGATVVDVNQEHGFVEGRDPLPFERLAPGARVRVLPNHACITAAMFDRYHVVDGGPEVVAVWRRINGW